MAPDLNVHCGVCQVLKEGMHCSIQCADCRSWIHYRCTKLPLYQLLTLATTNRSYTCEKCAMNAFSGRATSEWFESARAALEETDGAQGGANTAERSNLPEANVNSNVAETETAYPDLESLFPSQIGGIDQSDRTQETSVGSVETTAGMGEGGGGEAPAEIVSNRPANTNDTMDTASTRNTYPNTTRINTTPRNTHNIGTTPICRFYKSRNCRHGISGRGCQYTHPRPCAKFMQHGLDRRLGCKRGRYCKDYHPTICRGSLFRGLCENRDCKYTHLWGTRRGGNPRETWGNQYSTREGSSGQSWRRPHNAPPPSRMPHNAPHSRHYPHHSHTDNSHQQDRYTAGPDQSIFLDNITQKMTELHQQAQNEMMQRITEIQQHTHTLLNQMGNRVGMLESVQNRGSFAPHY